MTRAIFIGSILLASQLLASEIVAIEPWRDRLFEASPADILAAARSLAPSKSSLETSTSPSVQVLFRDVSYTFGLDHRAIFKQVLVYQILREEGLDAFGASEVRFHPWHQEAEIRARIIGPTERIHWLEADSAAEALHQAVIERRERATVQVPLPGVTVGAVIEEEITVRDLKPYFAGGRSYVHRLVMSQPIHEQRLTLDAPIQLPLRYGVRQTESLKPQRELYEDRVRLTFMDGPRSIVAASEAGLPAHLPRHPQVAFSTGESWQSVATLYDSLVQENLEVRAPTDGSERSALKKQPEKQIALFLQQRRSSKALTYPALNRRPVEPRVGDGSSLDLALDLVKHLRALDLPAQVILVKRGLGKDVESNLPGLGGFDHALVVVQGTVPKMSGTTQELWIDPADPLVRVGQLAPELQGRRALILDPETEQLVLTPISTSDANRTEVEIEIELAEEGPGRVVESRRFYGAPEVLQRRLRFGMDEPSRRRGYAEHARLTYRAEALGELEESDPLDLSAPHALRFEALRCGRALRFGDEVAVGLSISDLLLSLPAALLLEGETRRAPFIFPYAYEIEWRIRIQAPRGFRVRSLPPDEVWRLGTVQLEQRFEQDGNLVEAEFRLDSGPRLLSPEKFEETRFKVGEFLRRDSLVVELKR